MERHPYPHKIVLQTSGFRAPSRHLFFGRARLFFDRIELRGWEPRDRYRQVIFLDAVQRIEWDPETPARANVVFHLDDGRSVPLHLKRPSVWRQALEGRMHWMTTQRRFPAAQDRNASLTLKEIVAYAASFS